MRKRKQISEKQQIAWLKKRVSVLEEKNLNLSNKLHSESYFWKHDKKELVAKMCAIHDQLKKSVQINRIFSVMQFVANVLISFWCAFMLAMLFWKWLGV